MIEYITDAFMAAGFEPVVAASMKTPMTMNWCRVRGIAFCKAEGKGYVEDMVESVLGLEEQGSLFICVSDIPCITPDIIRFIFASYQSCGKDALSTWIPAKLVKSCRGGMPYRETIDGIEACPAGINILRGDRIGEVQNECSLLLDEPRLAVNVNTPSDLAHAENILRMHTSL
jgi:adenosylcobinamide-phosphate guanylyltransferase